MPKVLTLNQLSYILTVDENTLKCCVADCQYPKKLGSPFCWFCINKCCNEGCQNEAMISSIFCTSCLVKN